MEFSEYLISIAEKYSRNIEEDLGKIADKVIDELAMIGTNVGFGAPGIDPVRPFGSSLSIAPDLLEIIGWKYVSEDDNWEVNRDQEAYVTELYDDELIPYIKEQWKKIPAPEKETPQYIPITGKNLECLEDPNCL